MGQLAERVPVAQRKPQAVERRPTIAEAQPSRSNSHSNGFGAARVRSPVSEIVGGLPSRLRAGVEGLSGIAMDDVRVHRNSSDPAKLGALAFTRGTEIHLGPGQEQHLPHEAWHVVQQKEGRVPATIQVKDTAVNEDSRLEREADEIAPRLTNPVLLNGRHSLQKSLFALVVQLQKSKKKTAKPKEKKLSYSEIRKLVATNNASGQSDELIIAIIYKESRFNTLDKAGTSTATGLMQMTKSAVKELNKRSKTKFKHGDMTDPAKAIAAGTAYLKIRISWAKGDVNAGLDGYGTGPGYSDNLRKAEEALKKNPADPIEALTQTIGKP